MNAVTVPWLELLGCVIISKPISQGFYSLKGQDFEVILCWIKGKEKTQKPWIQNRVVLIRKVVDKEKWNHVRGIGNPANIPTRFCPDSDLRRWFDGPEFLCNLEFPVDEPNK